jgi:hypothetical protein
MLLTSLRLFCASPLVSQLLLMTTLSTIIKVVMAVYPTKKPIFEVKSFVCLYYD